MKNNCDDEMKMMCEFFFQNVSDNQNPLPETKSTYFKNFENVISQTKYINK